MWTRVLTFLSGGLLFAPTALAQTDTDTDTVPGPSVVESDGSETKDDSVRASPEVQTQVGLGTQKDEAPPETYTPSSPFEGDSERDRRARKTDYGHFMQLGVRAGVSIPYKIMLRFEDSPPCNIDGDGGSGKVCGLGAPPALDLALSFALLDMLEPYAWVRMGLGDEKKTNTEALRVFGVGARIYTMDSSMFKIFFEPAVGVETEGALDEDSAPNANYGTDFYLHLNAGLQVDFIRYVGLYVAVGPNVSFVRAITTTLEGNAGVQFRVP